MKFIYLFGLQQINTKRISLTIVALFFYSALFSQIALINSGCNILVVGSTATPTINQNNCISVFGDYVNNSSAGVDGSLELFGGTFSLSEDWVNDANNNAITSNLGTNSDGFVIFNGIGTPVQFIDGSNPTHFDNLVLFKNRKTLSNDLNLANGRIILDGIYELNGKTFILNNPNTNSINYLSGFIKSETFPGNYGLFQWNIGTNLGTYSIPFGNDINSNTKNLELSFKVKTPMSNGDFLSFATYNTDIFNQPMPTGSTPLELDVRWVVDRFWIIRPSNTITKPDMDLTFSFTSDDLFPPGNSLNIKKLKASRNNTTLGQWLDFIPKGQQSNNTVTINNVSGNDLFEPWTLVNTAEPLTEVFVPDAFTPNGDGTNDMFFPIFQVNFEVIDYELFIYNRWGQQVFHTKDQSQGWDGYAPGGGEPQIGVYSWVLLLKGKDNENEEATGVSKKFVGKVTLYR